MTQVELAQRRLFDPTALGASNIKLFRGTSRDVTAEQVAATVNRALSQLEAGDYEIVVLD